MIKLKFVEKDDPVTEILDRLKKMALAFKEESLEQGEVELEHSDIQLEGEKAIHQYLDEIEGQLGEWWYCAC